MVRGLHHLLVATTLTSLAALVLAGCGSVGTDHDATDVTFASEMVAHHQQAVEMVDLIGDRAVTYAFRDLSDGIRDAQRDEIDEMTGWLADWGRSVPEPTESGDMDMGDSMDGMMTADEMAALEAAPDATFEQQWLTLMIEHHRGAISMARTEIAGGEDDDAVALARHIVDTQTDEIDQMQALLAR